MNFSSHFLHRKALAVRRILLIDDDEDDYVLIRQMLSEAREGSFVLEWISSFDEGLAALVGPGGSPAGGFDAVIVDYDMGCHNGIELIQEAVRRGYPAPILLLTGRGTYDVDVEAMEAGAADYLSKGEMNAAFLERAIRYAIERKKAAVEREQLLSEQRQQREFLERLVRYAPIAIAVLEGEDLRYRMVNPAYQAIAGPALPVVGRTYREIFPEAAEQGVEEAMRSVQRSGEPLPVRDFPMPIPGSEEISWWEGQMLPLPAADGGLNALLSLTWDITGRRSAEDTLRASEERYRSLFNTMLNGFAVHEIICDAGGQPVDYRFLEVNPAFEQLTGLKAAQIIGRTVLEVLPGIDPVWIETYGRVALSGEPVQFEQYAAPLERYYQVYAYAPQRGQFATIFSDITERMRTEASLRESENRFRALFNNRHSVMLLVDPDTAQIVDANPAAVSFYGWSREEMLAMKVTDINLLPVDQTHQKMGQAQSATTSAIFQFQHRLASGEIRDVDVHSGPIQISEKQYLFSIIHDVTEHKKTQRALHASEDRYRRFFDNLRETVILFEAVRDAQGQVVDWVFVDINALALQLMGMERDQVIGRRAHDLLGPGALGPYADEYNQVLAGGKPSMHEAKHQEKSFLVTVFKMDENTVAATGMDISERKQMEEALQRAHERAAWLARFPEENPNPVARVSADGRVLYHNPAAASLPGWKCCENERIEEPLWVIVQQAVQQKQPLTQDVALAGRYYSISATPFLEDQYVNLYGRDVTERRKTEAALRETEERFRIALANTSIAVFSTDRDLRYTWFYSNAMGSIPEQFVGKRDEEILPAENVAELVALKQRVMQERKALREEVTIQEDSRKALMVASIEPWLDREGKLLGVTGSLFDITEQRRLETEILEHHMEMEIQARLSEYREKERQEIAHDLHDGPVQDLSSLIFSIQFTKEAVLDPAIKLELEQVRSSLKATVQDLRGMINDLRPPSLIRFGVVKAIQFHAEDFREKHPEIEIELELNAQENDQRLPELVNLTLFRIYQEAVNNIARHAQASRMQVRLEQSDDQVRLEVADNGKGFSLAEPAVDHTQHNHFGLAGMKERAAAIGGEFQLSSAPGEGTCIQVKVPIPDQTDPPPGNKHR